MRGSSSGDGLLTGGVVTAAQRAAVIEFIESNPTDDLNAARVTRATGSVTGFSGARVSGGAQYAAAPTKPVTVELFVDGVLRASHTGIPFEDASSHAFDVAIVPGASRAPRGLEAQRRHCDVHRDCRTRVGRALMLCVNTLGVSHIQK